MKNKVEIIESEPIEDKSNLSYQLSTIAAQKPNDKLFNLFRTRLWFYNQAANGDSTKFKQWVLRRIGESPSIIDSLKTEKTESEMRLFMNNKGYFKAKVSSETKMKKRKARVTYSVEPDSLYRVGKVTYDTKSQVVERELKQNQKDSHIQLGKAISRNNFESERNRIFRTFRNEGYYNFFPNYIAFEGDSSNYSVDVKIKIANPDSLFDQKYEVSRVFIHSKYNARDYAREELDTMVVDGYYFVYPKLEIEGAETKELLGIKPAIIINSIQIAASGENYNLADYERTIKRLSNLNTYRFINVKYSPSLDIEEEKLICNIFLTPSKKNEFGVNLELNSVYGNESAINPAIGPAIGTGISINYQNRNFLKGAELFTVSANGGVEYPLGRDTDLDRIWNTVDLGVSANLYYPTFWPKAIFKDKVTKIGAEKTRLSVSYDYLSRINFYTYNAFSSSIGWEWLEGPQKKHAVNPVVISYFNPIQISDTFNTILSQNLLLARSFDEQFILGPSYTFKYSGLTNSNGYTFSFRWKFEMGIPLGDGIAGIPFSDFVRLENDAVLNKRIGRNSVLAGRFFLGVGTTLLSSTNSMPYFKQFFVGGPNSIRGWRARELGPGAYIDEAVQNDRNIQPYQSGDLKMEMNLEYRFNMFSYLESALFIDAGNVWTLKEDLTRPGAQFSSNFLDQIAIAGGLGFRLDYSYFIFRLDVGYPLRIPRIEENGGSYWKYEQWRDIGIQSILNDPEFNVALGYPF